VPGGHGRFHRLALTLIQHVTTLLDRALGDLPIDPPDAF
jgi:hypothetical protein